MGYACFTGLVVSLIALAGTTNAGEPHPGLGVVDGVLVKDGAPYRGIGANYFSLFGRILKDPADESSLKNLPELSKAGVPFVRFMCGGFWPAEQKLYLYNREEYFRRLDRVVRAAEEAKIGLVPSLFWHYATVSDLVGEPLDQLGEPSSKSIAFIRQYTRDVVGRYKDSPAIWAWELGNEYNLPCDLPNAAQHRPPLLPNLGTPTTRTARDEIKSAHFQAAMGAFAEEARKIDPWRILLTGNSIPRSCAWHNSSERTWTADTPEQFAQVLLRDNPDPFDVVTIHVYHETGGKYSGPAADIDGMIGAASRAAAKAGKPLFVGEFGAPRQLGPEKERAVFEEMLRAIEKHRVPLAAFWVFDLPDQNGDWNVDWRNDRAYMIDLVARTNARLR